MAVTGCVRAPEQAVCPTLHEGDLAVTEIRGPQTDEADTLGQWLELYNASGSSVDLQGMTIRFRKKDGSSETDVLIRRSVVAAADSYTVLGPFDDEARPDYVDYGFASDFVGVTWLAAAAVDVDSCGELIDRVTYDALPKLGTYSFGGPPSASGNDFPTAWCTDATAAGTPQQENVACP